MEIAVDRPSHVSAVRSCVAAAYGHYVEQIGKPPAPLLDDYEKLVSQQIVHVAIEDGQVLGVIVMREEADYLSIGNIAVHPMAQGRGLGSELLAHADRACCAAGREEIRLYTNTAMTENLSFYVRRGFVETHRAKVGGYDRAFFARTIGSR